MLNNLHYGHIFARMETGRLYIPNLNPIPLFLSSQKPCCYNIKYQQGDLTSLQFACADSEFTITIYLKEQSGKIVSTYTPNVSILNTDHKYRFYTTVLRFDVPEGLYYLQVEAINNIGEKCSYFSPCIDIKQTHEKTVLIEYFNSKNANNVFFDSGVLFTLRVEGGFYPKSFNPKADENIYQNQIVTFQLLESTPFNSNFFTAGGERGIPDWFFDKIHRAFSCDNLIINDVLMVKYPEAQWEPNEVEGYPFRTWRIEAVQSNDNISKPVLCVEQAIYNCTFEWLDDAAVCQFEGKTDNFPFANVSPNGFNSTTAFINVNITFPRPVASNLQIPFYCTLNIMRASGPPQYVPYYGNAHIPTGMPHTSNGFVVPIPSAPGDIQSVIVTGGGIQNVIPNEDDTYVYRGPVPPPVKTGNSLRTKGIYRLYRNNVLQSQVNHNILDAFDSYPAITIEQWSKYTDAQALERGAAKIASMDKCSDFKEIKLIIAYGACEEVNIDAIGHYNDNNGYIIDFGAKSAIITNY